MACQAACLEQAIERSGKLAQKGAELGRGTRRRRRIVPGMGLHHCSFGDAGGTCRRGK
jgi:hypothetical protein